MSLATLRTAMVERFGAVMPVFVTRDTLGGRLELEELRRRAARTPALFIACLGVGAVRRVGSSRQLDARWGAFVFTIDAGSVKRDEAGIALAQGVLEAVADERWNNEATSAPSDLRADCLYSPALDKHGAALWAVTWVQGVTVPPNDPAQLVALERIMLTTTPEGGTNPAPVQDQIELDQ